MKVPQTTDDQGCVNSMTISGGGVYFKIAAGVIFGCTFSYLLQ